MDYHLRQLERLYESTESPEVGARLIRIHLRRGGKLSDFARDNAITEKSKYPPHLVWDEMMGRPEGTSKQSIREVSIELARRGWKANPAETMIFLNGEDALHCLRVVWPELSIPYLPEKQTLVLEDNPTLSPDMLLSISGIQVAASGNRLSNLRTPTAKIPFEDGLATIALEVLDRCVYTIFHGASTNPDLEWCSRGQLYSPDKETQG